MPEVETTDKKKTRAIVVWGLHGMKTMMHPQSLNNDKKLPVPLKKKSDRLRMQTQVYTAANIHKHIHVAVKPSSGTAVYPILALFFQLLLIYQSDWVFNQQLQLHQSAAAVLKQTAEIESQIFRKD